ncbi:hypothetical protein HanRHA438_Chr09g0383061 [Helianthus annuus]|nr:hypothetical protein HanHA89_Chr09g0325561 [Helianthus annuus]KAJ0706267.1 hypothetical protein HanLR1_Chr09g0305061 [Helianthus annuus]KAJ0886753.1 hypothetical protein HanRHA438_Chr09g0383061 [Helianthus annuus]
MRVAPPSPLSFFGELPRPPSPNWVTAGMAAVFPLGELGHRGHSPLVPRIPLLRRRIKHMDWEIKGKCFFFRFHSQTTYSQKTNARFSFFIEVFKEFFFFFFFLLK